MILNTFQAVKNYQAYIVNLSAVYKLAPLAKVLDNFADLHYRYANSWFGKWYSKLWVKLKYLILTNLIEDYKLGKVNTEQFVKQLLDTFYFLENNPAVDAPRQLLENTWNSLIIWDAESTDTLNYLESLALNNKLIAFVSDNNPLNIQAIQTEIQKSLGQEMTWQEKEIGLGKFLVYKNYRIMPSYLNGMFKAHGLIERLVEQLLIERKDRENILLISQYKSDLAEAKTLGIESKPADKFFSFALALSPPALLNNTMTTITAQPHLSSIHNNLIKANKSRPFFSGQVSKNDKNSKNEIENQHFSSEVTPLLS